MKETAKVKSLVGAALFFVAFVAQIYLYNQIFSQYALSGLPVALMMDVAIAVCLLIGAVVGLGGGFKSGKSMNIALVITLAYITFSVIFRQFYATFYAGAFNQQDVKLGYVILIVKLVVMLAALLLCLPAKTSEVTVVLEGDNTAAAVLTEEVSATINDAMDQLEDAQCATAELTIEAEEKAEQ